MKNCKDMDIIIKYQPCWQNGNIFGGGARYFTQYQRSIKCDISVNLMNNETTFHIFGTEKGLYNLGKYFIAESSWKCWYDHYHCHYRDICNRNNIPFINLIVHKEKGTDIIKSKKETIKEKTKKIKLYYYNDFTDEKGVFHYGNVCSPKYTDELFVSIYDDETFDDEFEEFFKNGKFQVNFSASDRAMCEFGKYLINVSMFKTKNKKYVGTIKNVASDDGKRINIYISKI